MPRKKVHTSPSRAQATMLDPAYGSRPSRIQRTSSVDTRKEISADTWISLLTLLKPREYFLSVDNTPIWRRHLSWAKTDGKELRQLLVSKFGTNMVFMSLLLGAEMNVLFNSNRLCTEMRQDMQEMNLTPHFWCGIAIIVSVICTLFTIMTTFTSWSLVSVISDANSHALLRSSIGQYACFLPSKLIVAAIYSFIVWISLFVYIMMPHFWSIIVIAAILLLFFHVMAVYSAFGRLILHSGAMGDSPIFDPTFEAELLPRGLHTSLLFKALDELRKGTSVTRQYKYPSKPIGRVDSMDALTVECGSSRDTPIATDMPSGSVHFADTSSINSTSGRSYTSDVHRGFGEHQRIGSNPSLSDSISPGLAEQWLSRSGSLDSAEGRTTPKVDTSSHLLVPPRGPGRNSASTTPQNDDIAQDSSRSSFSKMRPSLLNAGAHTLKSIRRMAVEVDSEDDESFNAERKETISPSYSGQITRMKSPPNVEKSVENTTSGTEKQQLLPKPSLRPPTYTGGANSRSSPRHSFPSPNGADTAIKTQHLRVESDPPNLSSKIFNRPAAMRRRTDTAELIDIVAKCVSPSKGHREEESSAAWVDTAHYDDELGTSSLL